MQEGAPVKLAERLFWITGWAFDFSKVASLLLIVGLIIHYFFFSVLVVRGRSMEPIYQDGDVLVINKISYLISAPDRGDVIAMFFPGETEKRFVKRIIGLPGETIKVQSGWVYVDNTLLAEPYLPGSIATIPDSERKLESGEYFAFGDNRSVSSDSRAWGPVPKSFIIGKISARVTKLAPEPAAAVD